MSEVTGHYYLFIIIQYYNQPLSAHERGPQDLYEVRKVASKEGDSYICV